MSVYKRPNASTYSYDFEVGGNRFSGDTGKKSKREAVAEQNRLRDQARLRLKANRASGADMTFGAAAARYMIEVGQHHKNADTTLTNLEWLEAALGKSRRLSSIDDEVVAFLVAKRRIEPRKVGNKNTPKRAVSPATVNRTCTEPLRKVLRRAQKTWKATVQDIDWPSHMLEEPQERVREASISEEDAFMDVLDRGYDDAVAFAVLTGCRRMEIVGLRWEHVDFFSRQFIVTGKADRTRSIPMSNAVFDLLWSLKDNDPSVVFTYIAARTDRRKGIVRGVRYPVTDSGLRSASRRAMTNAKVSNLRFHDLRHTAATRILRSSNLRVVQTLLGHRDVSTTTKYAHALNEDVRAAMDATSPTHIPTAEVEFRLNSLKKKGKSD